MRILALLVLSLAALNANALPSVEDVQHAVHRGDYSAAESMVREVLAAKPDNAKAHYILAELLAHQGKLAEARTQASTAQQLDPAIRFTAPERFRQFEAELGSKAKPAAATAPPRKTAESSSGGSGLLWIVLLLGAGAVFLMMRRRPAPPAGYAAGNYPGTPGGAPGGPGYPGYPPAQPPGGIGPMAAGLGGIAAGMVAEHLIEEALDRRHHASDMPQAFEHPSAPESLEDRPIDFGNGGDWGGDSSGGDTGGGFDSGSGGDWS